MSGAALAPMVTDCSMMTCITWGTACGQLFGALLTLFSNAFEVTVARSPPVLEIAASVCAASACVAAPQTVSHQGLRQNCWSPVFLLQECCTSTAIIHIGGGMQLDGPGADLRCMLG